MPTFCGMLDELAFLPVDLVPEGMAYVGEVAPDALGCILDYFDATYVSSAFRTVLGNGKLRFRRTPPRFALSVWNVHKVTINGAERTNNACESWNNGFLAWSATVTRTSGSPSRASGRKTLRRRRRHTESRMDSRVKRRRRKNAVRHQATLKKMCLRLRSGQFTVSGFLQAIGHCVRLDRVYIVIFVTIKSVHDGPNVGQLVPWTSGTMPFLTKVDNWDHPLMSRFFQSGQLETHLS